MLNWFRNMTPASPDFSNSFSETDGVVIIAHRADRLVLLERFWLTYKSIVIVHP
jgi:hypothetical protein